MADIGCDCCRGLGCRRCEPDICDVCDRLADRGDHKQCRNRCHELFATAVGERARRILSDLPRDPAEVIAARRGALLTATSRRKRREAA